MADVERSAFFADTARNLCGRLTRRQMEVLLLSAKGLSSAEVGAALGGLSYSTVDRHKEFVRRKLEVSTMIECAVLAAKAGLV